MKPDLKDRVIWVTGASSGIGRGAALGLAACGNTVYASARNAESLQELAEESGGTIIALPCDVTDRAANHDAVATIVEKEGRLDIALLNAGTCEYLDARNFDAEMCERVMRVNYVGMIYGIEAALPALRKSDVPYLVAMSSTVSYMGLPRGEAYGASKAAVRYFMQGLRAHLANEKIDVSVICPGFVKTPLTDQNDFPMPMRISVEKASDYIVSGMKKRKCEIHFPKGFSIPLKLFGMLPDPVRHFFLKRMVSG